MGVIIFRNPYYHLVICISSVYGYCLERVVHAALREGTTWAYQWLIDISTRRLIYKNGTSWLILFFSSAKPRNICSLGFLPSFLSQNSLFTFSHISLFFVCLAAAFPGLLYTYTALNFLFYAHALTSVLPPQVSFDWGGCRMNHPSPLFYNFSFTSIILNVDPIAEFVIQWSSSSGRMRSKLLPHISPTASCLWVDSMIDWLIDGSYKYWWSKLCPVFLCLFVLPPAFVHSQCFI